MNNLLKKFEYTFWLNPRHCNKCNRKRKGTLQPFQILFSCVYLMSQRAIVHQFRCRQVKFLNPKLNRLHLEMPGCFLMVKSAVAMKRKKRNKICNLFRYDNFNF